MSNNVEKKKTPATLNDEVKTKKMQPQKRREYLSCQRQRRQRAAQPGIPLMDGIHFVPTSKYNRSEVGPRDAYCC